MTSSVSRFLPSVPKDEPPSSAHEQPCVESPGSSRPSSGQSAVNDDLGTQQPSCPKAEHTGLIRGFESLHLTQRDVNSTPFPHYFIPVGGSASDESSLLSRFLMHSQLADMLGIMHPDGSASEFDTRMPTFSKPQAFPAFLDKYWTAMKERNKTLERTASAVSEATSSVYGDQIESWTAFMDKCLAHREVPLQPQTTLHDLLHTVREALRDGVRRTGRFLSLLPGFQDLNLGDRQALVSEKWVFAWLFHHSAYLCNDELFYTIGPDQIHVGRYWLDQLVDPDLVRYVISLMKDINDAQLTLVEKYMLMAVGIFRQADTTAVKNTNHSTFLHAHYLDALNYHIGTRLPLAERAGAFGKVGRIMEHFPVVQKLASDYVMALDLRRAPFRTSNGVTVAEILRQVSALTMPL